MAAGLAHRGPDGEGIWTSPSGLACLAHRRLSVIDLELGSQPFVSDDQLRSLVFNGEIYNYIELREELKSEGARFRTQSDTEVLLEGLRLRGVNVLDAVRGMFAFAYWDETRHQLMLARDRVGKKPLFYTVHDGCIYFCSTLEALSGAVRTRLAINHTAIATFLEVGYVPAPDTVYHDTWKLAAASYLIASPGGIAPASTRYWHPLRDRDTTMPPASGIVQTLDELMEDAVRLRLRSDVPLGVFLSGGVDSSLVTALAVEQSAERVSTFTIGFDVAQVDERARARQVAEHLNTLHREVIVRPDVLDLLPRMLRHFGEPFADSAAMPLWYLSEAASEHITVALLGDGGDEAFAGYEWYRTAATLERMSRWAKREPLHRALKVAEASLGGRIQRVAHLLTAESDERFADLRCLFGPRTTGRVLTERFEGEVHPDQLMRSRIAKLYREQDDRPTLAMQYADLRTYLADGLLPKVDVCSMAHSLEARAPLLDHRIIEFAYSLPSELHHKQPSKALEREVLGRHLPARFSQGPKMGFTVPLRQWFRHELKGRLERLTTGSMMDTGWFEASGVKALVSDHLAGRRDNSERLYSLVVLDTWLEATPASGQA